jgi:hypothetical protein
MSIDQNHIQIIEKFTALSTLIQSSIESIDNRILNQSTTQLNETITEYIKNSYSQFIIESHNLLQALHDTTNSKLEEITNKFYAESSSSMKQILNKLNNQSVEEKILKKFKKLMKAVATSLEKFQEVENIIEAIGQETLREADKKLEFIFNYLKLINQENQPYLQGTNQEVNKLVEGSLVIMENIRTADGKNERRKNDLETSIKIATNSIEETKTIINDSTVNIINNIQRSNEDSRNLTGQVMISILDNAKEATAELAKNQIEANEKIIQAGNRLSNIALQTQEELTQIKENLA